MQGMEMTILAKLDLGDWQELFSDRIYERGLAYYEDEAVHDIERTKNKIPHTIYILHQLSILILLKGRNTC